MPVKNYSPELLKVFEIGSQKEFTFDCKSEKQAHAFRWRLHCLRREMRKEKHWLLPVAETVVLSIQGSHLIAHPPDYKIVPALRETIKEHGGEVNLTEPKEYKDKDSNEGVSNYLGRKGK
jgi:hypothetical protein